MFERLIVFPNEIRPSSCLLRQSRQIGQYLYDESKWRQDPQFEFEEGVVSGMLCSFEAYNKPTRQPDNKYTLEG